MSMKEAIKIVDRGEIALVEWDLPGEKVNKLSSPVMERLKEVLDELKDSKYKVAVMVSRKKNIFIAGADIEEIKNLKTKEEFLPKLQSAHEIFNSLEDHPVTFIAAIDGACLGGGCEMVLACDYRIGSDSSSTKIGLPEVQLGILPGFGGCVRLPRVVGLQASLDIILAGKSVPGKKAKKIGLIDECVPAPIIEKRALEIAEEVVAGKKGKRKKTFEAKGMANKVLDSALGRPIVFSKAKEMVMKNSKGFYPAPLEALEVIKKTYGSSNRTKCLDIEMEGFCKVATTDISKHLINLFYMMEDVKKQNGVSHNPDIKGKDVNYMAVLGAGVMGGGIAYVAADKGIDVRLKDINNQGLAIGFGAARKLWEKKLKRRRLNKYEFQAKLDLVSGGLDYAGFRRADVVVEAIVEDMDIKKKVIAETVEHCSPDTIIATNTSSLSVTEMAKAHPNPKNFLGMHFFNPVHMMPLVEVIRGAETSDTATATIFNLSKKMGKTPVVVKDGPGFLVNRLLLPYMGEALFLLEEGMAIDTVDRYFTHKLGMPMGPFRLLDEVGLDVAIKVLKIFKSALGDRIEISELSEKLSSGDRLGKKNGKGFYLFDERGKETGVDTSIYGELGLSTPKDPLSEKECLQRPLFQMINEAARALIEDKIVERPEEVDLAMIMGTGFPPFRGGLLRYADELGVQYIVQELEIYAQKGPRFQPAPSIVELANNKGSFYGGAAGEVKKTSEPVSEERGMTL